jgi:hypothetical protein
MRRIPWRREFDSDGDGHRVRLLKRTIDNDRYPLSPRLDPLKAILGQIVRRHATLKTLCIMEGRRVRERSASWARRNRPRLVWRPGESRRSLPTHPSQARGVQEPAEHAAALRA